MQVPTLKNESQQGKRSLIPLSEDVRLKHQKLHEAIKRKIIKYNAARGDPSNVPYILAYKIKLFKEKSSTGIMDDIGI